LQNQNFVTLHIYLFGEASLFIA